MPKSLVAFPLIYFCIDAYLRSDVLGSYSSPQLLMYIGSIAVSVGFYVFVLLLANRLQHRKVLCYSLLIGYASLIVIATMGSYSFYFFNGFFPNYYTFEYFKNEPESAFVLVKDSLRWYEALVLLIAVLSLFFWWRKQTKKSWNWNSSTVIGSSAIVLLFVFSGFVWKVKKYDQCLVADVNFAADIHRHFWEYESNRSFKGKGLGVRNPIQLKEVVSGDSLNVLVVLCESLRNQNLTSYGYARETTPNLSRFIRNNQNEVFVFKQPYTVSSTTMLAVPAVLSGIAPYQDKALFYKQPLIWSYGKAKQMATFFLSSHTMKWYRFDKFYQNEPLDYTWNKETSGIPFYNDMGVDDKYTISALVNHLERLEEKRFFGVIQLNGTHYPYHVPEEMKKWQGRFSDEYDNAIHYMDHHLKNVLDYLTTSGKLKNTVIVFTSDHGESLKDHANIGHVDSYYKEAISVPLIVYIPSELQDRVDIKTLRSNRYKVTSTIDVAPTIAHLLGFKDHHNTQKLYQHYSGFSLFDSIPRNRAVITMNNNSIARFNVGISLIDHQQHYIYRKNIVPNREEWYAHKLDKKESMNKWSVNKWRARKWVKEQISKYPEAARYLSPSCQ